MNKPLIIKWIIRLIFFIYFIININLWAQQLTPIVFDKYFSKLNITTLYNNIGLYVFLSVVLLLILHITNIFKIEKKIFWFILILFLTNLLLMYLEIKKQGDT